ncbi:MAG TPA: PAS domain-containing protein [Tepidisphaeraceae bacterium]|nr:PAS domain-containing protein [Tepidisphaeraceae bacterium]
MNSKPIKVLLVEDNPADAVLMRETLAESHYGEFSVTVVSRLDTAIQRLTEEPFDIVLLDLGLPDSQGLDTLKRLRKQSRAIPLVVLTGLSDEAMGVQALQNGAQDYLVKGETAGNLMARAVRYAIERKNAEEAFLASEQRLALTVDAVQVGIWSFDIATEVITWSDQVARLFAVDPLTFDGKRETLFQCIHPDDREVVRNRINAARTSGKDYTSEYRIIWPDGSLHWIESRGRVMLDDNKRPVRIMGTVVEITQRKLAEEAMRSRDAELAHLNRVNTMGQMASGLAHELNQPLSAILNYASVCLAQAESDKGSRSTILMAVQEIMNETRRAGAIISRMRSFVRKQRPKNEVVDINQLVTESLSILEFELRHQKIRPKIKLAEGLPGVLADPVQIEQVLVNLIYNALEAMSEKTPPGNMLRLETRRREDGGSVEISVIDSGCGVSEETMARLFEPFYTTKSKGLGMGLNISRSIVEGHGGRLSATPNPEGGMRFSFTLAIAEGATP